MKKRLGTITNECPTVAEKRQDVIHYVRSYLLTFNGNPVFDPSQPCGLSNSIVRHVLILARLIEAAEANTVKVATNDFETMKRLEKTLRGDFERLSSGLNVLADSLASRQVRRYAEQILERLESK